MTSLSSASLLRLRVGRKWSQARMGEIAGITRQAYAAIESGRSVPSTEVALRLARALGIPVEELFQLKEEQPREIHVDAFGAGALPGRRVRLARVAGRDIAYPLEAGGMHARAFADGIGVESLPGERLRVRPLLDPSPRPELVVAGCDPAFGLVVEMLRRDHGVEVLWLPSGSRAALEALSRGTIHVAGVHLRDQETGRYNEPWVRRLVPFPVTRVSFATWEQCLLLAKGNPLGIEGVQDLARADLRFLNREPGSGSRALLELLLEEMCIPLDAVPGFLSTAADGHRAVAGGVASGAADAGVAIGAVALSHGLATIPLVEEPYELVIPNHFLELPAVAALLSTLRRPALRVQVEALGGYDGAAMGRPA